MVNRSVPFEHLESWLALGILSVFHMLEDALRDQFFDCLVRRRVKPKLNLNLSIVILTLETNLVPLIVRSYELKTHIDVIGYVFWLLHPFASFCKRHKKKRLFPTFEGGRAGWNEGGWG